MNILNRIRPFSQILLAIVTIFAMVFGSAYSTVKASGSLTAGDISVVKSGPETATAGQEITFTLSVKNNGTIVAPQGFYLTDRVDNALTFVKANSSDCTKNIANGEVICSRAGALAPNATVSYMLTFKIAQNTACGTIIPNKADVSVPDGTGGSVSTWSNMTSTKVVCAAPTPTPTPTPGVCKLELNKSVDKTVAKPGEEVTYTINFKNTGTANCTGSGVRLVDHLDEFVDFVSETHSANVIPGYIDKDVYDTATRTMYWNADVLTPGEAGSVGFTARVKGLGNCTNKDITNVANITALELNNFKTLVFSNTVKTNVTTNCTQPTPTPTPTSTPTPTPTPASTSLTVVKLVRNITQNGGFVENLSNVRTGDSLEYQIRIKNTGSVEAKNVTLNDFMTQAGSIVDFRNFTTSIAYTGALANGSTITFVNNLAPGQEIVIGYLLTTNAQITNGLSACNTATASSSNANTASDVSCITGSTGTTNLILSKSAWNDTKNVEATLVPASREDYITYRLTVRNIGTADAINYLITDDLSGVLPLADMVDAGGGVLSGHTITYPAVNITAGSSLSRTFRVRVKYYLSGNVSYQMTNYFGNSVIVQINLPPTYVPPKTGKGSTTALGFGFAGVLSVGAWLTRKKNLLKLIFT